MNPADVLLLSGGGLVAGILAGVLGVGGGVVLVPLLVTLGHPPVQCVATSSLAMAMAAAAGTLRNWRTGQLDLQRVALLGMPALVTAQLGVVAAEGAAPALLLGAFSLLCAVNLVLIGRQHRPAARREDSTAVPLSGPPASTGAPPGPARALARSGTGALAGFVAGLLGVGGGALIVPMQVILLADDMKTAVRTSLAVVALSAACSSAGHAVQGNLLPLHGLCLGTGALVGARLGVQFLPALPDIVVTRAFRGFVGLAGLYSLLQAWSAAGW
jgi:hypothetical protein